MGLPTIPLKSLSGSKHADYQRLLKSQIDAQVEGILSSDSYAPLHIPDAKTYKQQVLRFGLEAAVSHATFPTTMPFSAAVSDICKLLTRRMEDYCEFRFTMKPLQADGAREPGTSETKGDRESVLAGGGAIEDFYVDIVRFVDTALLDCVCSRLAPERLTKNRRNLPASMVSQLLRNCDALAAACSSHFESHAYCLVEAAYPSRPPPRHKTKLRAASSFDSLKMQFNIMLLQGLSEEIDEMLDLSSGDWMASRLEKYPWPVFDDLSSLFEARLASLDMLPTGLREGAYLHAFNHVSMTIRAFWRSDEFRGFTIVGLANFDRSLNAVEEISKRYSSITGMTEAMEDVRQMTDLILTEPRILNAGDKKYREHRYGRVQRDLLCAVLGKYKSLGMFTRTPAGLPNHSNRDIETTIKQIRGG